MPPRIKICGITDPAALDAAIAARCDYAGFVFFEASPRNLKPAKAAALAERAGGRIARVGLFVDPNDNAIAATVAAVRLDALQLHGRETPGRAADLRARFGLPVWKALAVTSRADVERAADYAGAADLVLFDARPPVGSSTPGGLGLAFDWSLVASYRGPLAWGLAGGLSPDSVAAALRLTGAPLVDVSSGVESAPGIKDAHAIAAFAFAARSA